MMPPIVKEITVPCPPARAFEVFHAEIAAWWPLDKHSLSGMSGHTAQGLEFQPRIGGQITEIMHDGARVHWGTVTEWQPSQHMAFTWQLGRPEDEATAVRLEFSSHDLGTKVRLTHSGWDARSEAGATARASYDSGWVGVFVDSFAGACK